MVLQIKLASKNDLQNALHHDLRLNTAEGNKPYFLADPATNQPLFRNYVHQNELFLIAQYGVPQPGELKLYQTGFSAALPPMVFRDLSGKPIPKFLAVGHGLLAVGGFVLLLIFALA